MQSLRLAPLMGFIAAYETPEGRRYKVRYRKPDHSEGAKRGFTSKREAKLWLASVEVDMSRNSYVDPVRARITVEVWMRTWPGTRADLRVTTRERVKGIIDRDIVPTLGRYPLGDLSHSRCQEWLHGLSDRLAPASVRKCASVLSGAPEAAVRDGRLGVNPARGMHLPRVSTTSKRYLTVAQVHDLAEVVDGIGAGKQNGAANGHGTLIRVLAFCGLRWGEVSGLRVGDVNFLRGRLEIQHTVVESGGVQFESTPQDCEARSVPVPKSILDELAVLVVVRRADGRCSGVPAAVVGPREGLPHRVAGQGRAAHRRARTDAARAASHGREHRGQPRCERESRAADARPRVRRGHARRVRRPVRCGHGCARRRPRSCGIASGCVQIASRSGLTRTRVEARDQVTP